MRNAAVPTVLRAGLGMLLGLALVFVAALTGAGACSSAPECYGAADCGTGTCCGGTCLEATPIPIGPATCGSGCECASWQDGDVARSQCLAYEGTGTTQCTRSCTEDSECLSSAGLQGRCLTRDEVVLAERLCVWEAP